MIVKGILDLISDGEKNIASFTERAYLKINGKRYKRICSSNVIDNVLQENLGNEIEVSTRFSLLFGNIIYSIKEKNGDVTRIGILHLIFMTLLRAVIWAIPLVPLIFIFMIMFYSDEYMVYVPLLLFIFPILSMVRDIVSTIKLK